jgi:hypothetical protein
MRSGNQTMERFVIRDFDPPAVALGVQWLTRYVRDHELQSGTLYTHARGAVENLEDAIGHRPASMLQRRHQTTIDGVTIDSATHRDSPRIGAPVLAVWVTDEELIDRLDRLNVPALCAIPWSDELANWIALRHPVDVETGQPVAVPTAKVRNPVLLRALESITMTSNLANGLDSRNRARLGHALMILRDGGEAVDPDETEAWAAQNGWGAKNAREIGELARAVIQGRGLRLGPTPFRPDILAAWRRAEGDD